MDQMGSHKGMDELEIIDADSRRVTELLGALPRVEAPANFEFRVKAGIANGSPSRSGLLPFLTTAAPLALLLVVVGFGLLYFQRPGAIEVAPINDIAASGPVVPRAQGETVPAPSSSVTVPSREIEPAPVARVSSEVSRTASARRTPNSSNRAQGNSFVITQGQANVFMPPGTESANPRNRNANTAAASMTDMPVRDVLEMHGVEGDFADGGWKVRSVKENSLGARAKIVAGDVIESIDGQPVKNETKLKGGVKTFTVRRDGKVTTLSPGN